MRGAGALLLLLGLAACTPQDPAQRAEQNYAICTHVGLAPQRLTACSELIGDANAPVPQRVEALIARGVIRADERHYARAIGDFGRALRLDPNNVEALMQRGRTHRQRGAMDAAARDFDTVLRIQPGLQRAEQMRDEALSNLGRAFDDELDQLNAEIAESPREDSLFNARCWLRAVNGRDLELALADCNEALRLQPRAAYTLDSRGLVNYKLGRFDAALADYDAALAIDPRSAHYKYGRGVSLIALGREDEGRAAMREAMGEDARVANLYRSYGVAP